MTPELSGMSDKHLFLLIPNDSGSTWLQNIISLCDNCVSFSESLDGKGACGTTGAYPNQPFNLNKLFSEEKERWQDPDEYNWAQIKSLWAKKWSTSPHFETASPRVFLEKTPQAIYSADMRSQHFDNSRFVISIRNPYAVCEGIRRTVRVTAPHFENISIERCARHWLECAKQQLTNIEKYKDTSVTITYEELTSDPQRFENELRDLIPDLYDIDLSKEASSHSVAGTASRELTNYNQKHIDNLNKKDIAGITGVLRQEINVLNYFGYHLKD
jgi:hypothetical protein